MPVTEKFIEHFPEAADIPNAITKNIASDSTGRVSTVTWKFELLGKEITWETAPVFSPDLTNGSVAIYPPQTSIKWHLYTAYGKGNKNKGAYWNLIDERGREGQLIEIDDEEYVSVISGTDNTPNRPRYLMLTDSTGQSRGIFFLHGIADNGAPGNNQASLAVDFGTSNTCLAYSFENTSEVLRFQMSPARVWGLKPRDSEIALEEFGFVPFDWSGEKGYFPTVLLTRKDDKELNHQLDPDKILLKHLVKVDIPGLHKKAETRFIQNDFARLWDAHANLKWQVGNNSSEPWRTLFLELLLLYAHAEMFFIHGKKIDTYTFTFPLAFTQESRDGFHDRTQSVLRRMRGYCYGSQYDRTSPNNDFTYHSHVNESSAIANAFKYGANKATMDVFMDIGGGSADFALRYNGEFVVLDSIRVAGRTFFQFGQRNFRPDLRLKNAGQFKKHLGKLLKNQDDEEFSFISNGGRVNLGVLYSLAINGLNDNEFSTRENALLARKMGDFSYQKYRTQLFFRHIIAYGLLQACAAAVDNKLKLSSGLNLVLSGNGWGLMLFADMSRRGNALRQEATNVLELMKRELLPTLDEAERAYLEPLKVFNLELLNSDNLSKAKTSVAKGALVTPHANGNDTNNTTPYAGIDVENLQINDAAPMHYRWHERWGLEEFKKKMRNPMMTGVGSASFDPPDDMERPMHPALGIFTLLGNPYSSDADKLPTDVWASMNSGVSSEINNIKGSVEGTPINHFISEVMYTQDDNPTRDFLDELAEQHGYFTED